MKPRWSLCGLVVLIGALALAGCGGSGTPAAPMPTTLSEPETPAYPMGTSAPEALPPATGYPAESEAPTVGYPIGSETPAAGQGADAAPLALAKQDLERRLSVAADQINVVSSTYMDWPDSSLGCPKTGIAYAQVITPGYKILLEQAQKQYDYHTDLTGQQLVLCTP